jgi:gamma-tubulin complex component 4
MYNQLAAWMVYGILQDPHGEFFIKRQDDGDLDHRSSQEEVSEKLARTSVHETSLTDWHSGFHISLDMLPDYIPMRLGESILFAGKAIRVLRNPSPAFQFQKDKSFQQTMRGSQRIRGFMHSDFPETETELDADLTGGELLPQSEADKIEAMLKDLKESSEFHKRSFECTVDSVRAIAASHLWQLVVVRADLNGHLKALKDYFLLEKGDFFQCFLEESRQLMRLPPRQSTGESDLMVPFQLVCGYNLNNFMIKVLFRSNCFCNVLSFGTHRLQQKPLRRKISISLGYPYGCLHLESQSDLLKLTW